MKGGERTAKHSTVGTAARRRLADITNADKSVFDYTTDEKTNETLQRLIKRNEELENVLLQRNEELENLREKQSNEAVKQRAVVQALRKQNVTLAQINNDLLADNNTAKERIKNMEHRILCNEALLKVKPTQNCCPIQGEVIDNVKVTTTTNILTEEQETVEAKRRCKRRQSSSFQSSNHENSELLLIEDFMVPSTNQLQENSSVPCQEAVNQPQVEAWQSEMVEKQMNRPVEDDESMSSQTTRPVVEMRRGSSLRPSRRAAEKVASYKEVSLKVKIRRN